MMRTKVSLLALSLLLVMGVLSTGAGASGPSVVATIPVGDLPQNVAVNADTNRIYMTHGGASALSVIDGSTNQLVDEVTVELPPFAVALNTVTGRIYASFSGRPDEEYIQAIDVATKQILATVQTGSWPIDIAVNTTTNRVYVVNHFDGNVMVIDGPTNQVVATVSVGSTPHKAAVDEARNRIYVENSDSVSVIDGVTNQVVDNIVLDQFAWGLALNPAADRIYVANIFDKSMSVIDVDSKAVLATVPVGTLPVALAVNPTTNHIIVTNQESDNVTIIDGATNTVIATLPVGDYPTGVAANQAANMVYVANNGDDTVSVISDPPSDATPTPAPTPPAGSTAFALATGWNQVCYVGVEQPIEDALAPILGDVSAVYRMGAGGGYDRWFPGRPEVSTITNVSPYRPLLLLMTEGAAWNQTPEGSPPTSAGLAQGWNTICYAGAAETPAEATSAIADGFSILYMLGSGQAWSRYVPGRPEVSNIEELEQYDAVLMLTNGGGTTWTFSP
jgi:YVTN family beta-propeller protein